MRGRRRCSAASWRGGGCSARRSLPSRALSTLRVKTGQFMSQSRALARPAHHFAQWMPSSVMLSVLFGALPVRE
jgi:hypothetical protein